MLSTGGSTSRNDGVSTIGISSPVHLILGWYFFIMDENGQVQAEWRPEGDFLGYTFRPDRMYREDEGGGGSLWLGYAASISRKAKKRLVQQIMKWKIHRATGAELGDIAQQKASVIRGWIYYYGRFRLYCMRPVFRALNVRLIRWVMNKYKRFRRRWSEARAYLVDICKSFPNLFEHWKYGFAP